MAKFHHLFTRKVKQPSCRTYVCGEYTARLDFISEKSLRVALYRDEAEILPTFCVCPGGEGPAEMRNRLDVSGFSLYEPQVQSEGSRDIFTLPGNIRIELETENFLLTYFSDDKILFADREPLAYNFDHEFGSDTFHYTTRQEGQRIFGLGDKGGVLNKSGGAFRIETTDCMGYDAEKSDPLYKHVPFYICENNTGCYGVFYDTSDTSYFDFGKEIDNYYPPYQYFSTKDDCLVYYVFFGTKLSILRQFCRLCGKQAFPPKWSFDYCASTMAYTDAPNSLEHMHSFIEKLNETDLSCGGFYLSSGYTSIGNRRYVFNWNTDKFPSPAKFVKEFADKGIKIIPNIKPAFLFDHPLYKKIADNGWFVKNPDGTPFVTRFWDGLGSYLDFTNPEAFDFWRNQVTKTLLNYGITSTWNDNNEFDIKDTDALAMGFGNGKVKASRIRPILSYLMVCASYKAQIEREAEKRPFLSTRSGNIAVRRLAQTWSGDNRSVFSDLRYCHYIGLTMSMSGYFFYGHDLGGFWGDMPSKELLLRWIQHGIFEPRMTIHSWNADGSATMPWSYPDIVPAVRSLFAQRKSLIPYIYSCAYEAVENEIPLNAPPFLYFDDPVLYDFPDQMMLGQNILVAFAFDEGVNLITAYLPKNTDWYLGEKRLKDGQKVLLEILPTNKMPFFIKEGCVLPTDEAEYGFQSKEKLIFTIYPVKSGTFTDEYFSDDGESFAYKDNVCVKLHFKVTCTKYRITVEWENKGKTKFEPEIRLYEGDERELQVKNQQPLINEQL